MTWTTTSTTSRASGGGRPGAGSRATRTAARPGRGRRARSQGSAGTGPLPRVSGTYAQANGRYAEADGNGRPASRYLSAPGYPPANGQAHPGYPPAGGREYPRYSSVGRSSVSRPSAGRPGAADDPAPAGKRVMGRLVLLPKALPLPGRVLREHRDVSGGWLRPAVFGAMDGLVTNSSLIAGVGGGGGARAAIVLTGIAGLIAGAFSMATGEYISVTSQNELTGMAFAVGHVIGGHIT